MSYEAHHRIRAENLPTTKKQRTNANEDEATDKSTVESDLVWFGRDDSGYCNTENNFLVHSVGYSRRPFPAYQVLVSSVDQAAQERKEERTHCPYIQDFLKSIHQSKKKPGEAPFENDDTFENQLKDDKKSHEKEICEPSEGEDAKGYDSLVVNFADSSHSTLTEKQHVRYLWLKGKCLAGDSSLWKEQTRKDYRNLRKLVSEEQTLYIKALYHFWETSRERLMIGFSNANASKTEVFALIAAYPKEIKNLYNKSETSKQSNDFFPHEQHYEGKCSQKISIYPQLADSVSAVHLLDSLSVVELDKAALKCESELEQDGAGIQHDDNIALISEIEFLPGEEIPVANEKRFNKVFQQQHQSLLYDKKALALAFKHNVQIITTKETLACLLQDPNSTTWTIPVIRRTSLNKNDSSPVILEPPLPQSFSGTRECLTRGFCEGIFQWLEAKRSTEKKGEVEETQKDLRVKYSLMTLPSGKRLIKNPVRVLVRAFERLDIENTSTPLNIHVNLEYFPEHGREIAPASDRALWILDNLLHPHSPPFDNSRTILARVNPQTCCILEVEDIGMAHAMAGDSEFSVAMSQSTGSKEAGNPEANGRMEQSENRDKMWKENPLEFWRVLIHLLHSITKVAKGNHLLCFPARSIDQGVTAICRKSVSVHSLNNHGDLNVCSEIENAGSLPLGPDSFRRCFRPWKWEHTNRVPYTFPLATTKAGQSYLDE